MPGSLISTNADGMHTCAVKEDGTVRCWGFNSAGQLGDGTTTNRSSPVPVAGLTSAVSVAAGDFHTCALLSNGTVHCWGSNSAGQLGDGSTTLRLAPVAVTGLSNVVALAAGNLHTCAVVVGGTARCWGRNSAGQVGDGTTIERHSAVPVGGVANAVAMAGGATHTCALLSNGSVRCWGANAQGQLGDGTTVAKLLSVPVTGLSNAVALATGSFHTCAIRADGTARCWGTNSNGELGDGSKTNRSAPVQVSGIAAAVSAAAGGHHSCAQLAGGGVQCWGLNTAGQVGDGTIVSPSPPVSVAGLVQTVAVTAGNSFSCALDAGETARCWGSNANGALGNASTITSSARPVVVAGGGGTIGGRGITGGGEHSCAGRASSAEACWGLNFNGQLGNGNQPNDSLLPTAVTTPSPFGTNLKLDLRGITVVTAGSDHSCSLIADGTVVCWGDNRFGQLGNGSTAQTQQLPGSAATGLTNAVTVAAGWYHTCAVQAGGTVQCWGRNNSGQFGNGNTIDHNVPVTALAGVFIAGRLTAFPLTNITAVAAGESHTCALSGDGHVICWGSNTHGQLGTTAATQSSSLPIAVAGATNAVAIAAGAAHTCALLATGNVICWGLNGNGQLGDDSTTDRFAPIFVQRIVPEGRFALEGIAALGAGKEHTCALRADSRIQCWGDNVRGQLGDGNAPTDQHLAFTFVKTLTPAGTFVQAAFVTLGVGFQHTCALLVSGQPLCWGRNVFGQLGNGSRSDSAFALPVPSFTFNVDPNVTLNGTGQVATVTALVNCPAGQQVRIEIGLTQGNASGQGRVVGVCHGGLERYPVMVPSQGPDRFAPGPAQAKADASVRDQATVTDTEHWTRQVNLALDDQ